MSTRTKKFDGKVFYHYAVVHGTAVDNVATFLRNRHYYVRTTPDEPKGYREVWTRPKVKGDGR